MANLSSEDTGLTDQAHLGGHPLLGRACSDKLLDYNYNKEPPLLNL